MSSRRRALMVILLATCLALVPASKIQLGTALEDLLPVGAPSSDQYRLFMQHSGGVAEVYVLLSAEEGREGSLNEDLLDAASRLEGYLRASPEISEVRAGLTDRDEHFYRQFVLGRSFWLVNDSNYAAWRERILAKLEPVAIQQRVRRLAALAKIPIGTLELQAARLDPFGFSDSIATPAKGTPDLGLPLDPLTGIFVSDQVALLIVTPVSGEIDPAGGRQLAAILKACFERVRAELEAPLKMSAIGGPLYAAHDEELVRRDLQRTITGSLIAITICLAFAFSSFSAPLAALAPVVIGLIWTAGWIGVLQPELTAVSVGFAAVLVGLGIDYGIHLGVRYRQERLDGRIPELALAAAWGHARRGILSSGGTTAAAFAVLGFASLRPIRELALVVGLGIVCIVAAVAAVGGSILVSFSTTAKVGWCWRMLGTSVTAMSGFGERRPHTVISLGIVATVFAAWAAKDISINPDLASLRPADGPISATEKLLVREFGLGLETATIIVHGAGPEELFVRANSVAELVKAELGETETQLSNPLSYLGSPTVNSDRVDDLVRLEISRAVLDMELELRSAGLDPVAFRVGLDALRSAGRGEGQGWPPVEEWPDWLRRAVDLEPDRSWASISVRLPDGVWDSGPPKGLVETLRSIDPDIIVASAAAVGSEIGNLAERDLRRLGTIAFAVVIGAVTFSFGGDVRRTILALTPVTLGTIWTLGAWSVLGWPLDLPAVAVLPILLGLGIDDGLHVVHATKLAPEAGIVGALRGTGRALVLTTLTTAVAFSSLLWSHVPGLRSAAGLIAFGVVACLLATVMILPAMGAGIRLAGRER